MELERSSINASFAISFSGSTVPRKVTQQSRRLCTLRKGWRCVCMCLGMKANGLRPMSISSRPREGLETPTTRKVALLADLTCWTNIMPLKEEAQGPNLSVAKSNTACIIVPRAPRANDRGEDQDISLPVLHIYVLSTPDHHRYAKSRLSVIAHSCWGSASESWMRR